MSTRVAGAEVSAYNPRYLAYCRAHGKTPEQMLTHDAEAWPGGKMCGFMLWIGACWQTWKKANKRGARDVLFEADHDNFDAFIGANVIAEAA